MSDMTREARRLVDGGDQAVAQATAYAAIAQAEALERIAGVLDGVRVAIGREGASAIRVVKWWA